MMQPGSSEPVRSGGSSFPWILVLGMFGVLTFNSVMALIHSKGDAAVVAFVATTYGDLLLLFGCIFFYRRAPPCSPRRERLKASVWILTTLLTFSFGYVVMGTAGLTLPIALLVWAIAAATGIGAFFAFFEQDRVNLAPADTMLLPPV